MEKYRCTVCNWVYDPAIGDPEHGIPAGTAFKDIPDDWVCPECGVGKEDFIAMTDHNNSTGNRMEGDNSYNNRSQADKTFNDNRMTADIAADSTNDQNRR